MGTRHSHGPCLAVTTIIKSKMPAKRTNTKSKQARKAARGPARGPPSPQQLSDQFDALGAAASIRECTDPIKHRQIRVGGKYVAFACPLRLVLTQF